MSRRDWLLYVALFGMLAAIAYSHGAMHGGIDALAKHIGVLEAKVERLESGRGVITLPPCSASVENNDVWPASTTRCRCGKGELGWAWSCLTGVWK